MLSFETEIDDITSDKSHVTAPGITGVGRVGKVAQGHCQQEKTNP